MNYEAVVVVVTGPIIFAVGGIALTLLVMWLAWVVRRDFETLARMPCPDCGRPFGREATMAAKQLFLQDATERRRKNPLFRLRMVGIWPVRCPGCGFKGHYYVQDGRLIPDE